MPDETDSVQSTGGQRSLTMLIVDNHALFRATVERFLREAWQDEVQIVSTTASDNVMTIAVSLRPRVVLIEVSRPLAEAWARITQLRQALADARIIALTWGISDAERAETLSAGADACLLKTHVDIELLGAIGATPQAGSAI